MTQADYLREQFRRYYPDADRIEIEAQDETIEATICWELNYTRYRMDIGSDDEMYSFINTTTERVLTIPFEPEEELSEEGPLWRTLFTENEQETIALLTIEDIRDCAKDLAHEQLDNIGADGLTELIAMIDPNLPVTVECLEAIRDGHASMDDYRSHEHVDHYVAAQFIERFDLVQNSEELSDRGRQYIEENS